MSEQDQEIQVEEVATETTEIQNAAPEVSEMEQRALDMGWRPEAEFNGDPDKWIDAEEFVRRKPLFEKIDNVGKELRETKKALKALQEHHQKVKDAEYKHALQQLREEKKVALENGDADKLIEIDDQIADEKLRQQQATMQAQQQAAQPHPNFIQWVNKNTWYKDNAELRVMADQVGTAYASSNPELDPDSVLKYVEGRIRKLYPEVFTNPNKSRPNAVEGSTSTPASKGGKENYDNYPLSEDERRVMNTFVRQGIMTKDEYIKELIRTK